jgi:hypothetical protein
VKLLRRILTYWILGIVLATIVHYLMSGAEHAFYFPIIMIIGLPMLLIGVVGFLQTYQGGDAVMEPSWLVNVEIALGGLIYGILMMFLLSGWKYLKKRT